MQFSVVLRLAKQTKSELKRAIQKHEQDPLKIPFPERKLSNIKNEVKPDILTGKWDKNEDLIILNKFKEKGITLNASDLEGVMNRSFPSIHGRIYNLSLCIQTERLKLKHDGKEDSVEAAVDSLITQIGDQPVISCVSLRRNKAYLNLLHQGIKKHGLDAYKIQAEFLPAFTLSAIGMDLQSYAVPDKTVLECLIHIEIGKHIEEYGFDKWDELAKRLVIEPKLLFKQWLKIEERFNSDPRTFEKQLAEIQSKNKLVWTTKRTRTLRLGMELFGSDIDQIQQKLLPDFDKEYLITKIKALDHDLKKSIIRYSLTPGKSLQDLADKTGIPLDYLVNEWQVIEKQRKKVTEAETRLDTELIKVHQNPNMNLKKLANDMGIDYKLVLARWTYLRKTFQLDGLKKGRSSRENLYNSFDEQQVDEWIIEYAEDPQKTLRQLSKEKGIAEGALYRRWNVLRETNGLKGLRGPPINNEIKVLDDKELASLSELDRDIIRYGTSEDLSLNLLCKELGNQTSIFFRWKILKERYQLESPQKKRWRGNKVN